MSLLWVIVGTFLQFSLGGFLMMGAVFGGAALAQGHTLSTRDNLVLTSAMLVLPFTSVASAIMVLIGYWNDSSASVYWWYGLPVLLAILYLLYARFCVTK